MHFHVVISSCPAPAACTGFPVLAPLPADKQRERGRGRAEKGVRRREMVANEVWVRIMGD